MEKNGNKTTAKVTPVKPVVSVKAEETVKKEAAKALDVKTEAAPKKEAVVKEVVTKEAAKTTEQKPAEKKPAEKKPAEQKPAAKKAPAKKAPARKTVKKPEEKIEEVYVQFEEQEVLAKEVLERAKQAYVSEGHRESSIKSIRLYIKPEEHMAYYVINEKAAGGVPL